MRQKNEKKLLSFLNFSLIDKMLKDISLLEGRNESLIAEEILLGYREPLLPPSKAANFIVRNFYAADDAVTLMYTSAFEQISTLINGHYIPQKEKILIDSLHSTLCRSQASYGTSSPRPEKFRLEWYIKQLSAYIEYLEMVHHNMPEPTLTNFDEKYKLCKEIEFGHDLLHELEKEPEYTMYHNVVNIILQTWAYAKESPTTYRLLASQMALINLPNTPENRLYAAAYIKEASSDWPG